MKLSSMIWLAGFSPLLAAAAEIPAPVSEVQIFRNGESVIRHSADPKGKKNFSVSGNFAPLSGTLWFSPNVKQIRKAIVETEKKEAVSLSDITSTYKGQRVTLRLRSDGIGKCEKISGTILELFKKESFDRGKFVTLKCADGRILAISRQQIVGVESSALKIAERTVKNKKHLWEFDLDPKIGGKVLFDYISKTLNWTPDFKMELLPEKKMKLSFSATVVNNGDDLEKVRCILWGGSPNIANSGKSSPMSIVRKEHNPPVPRLVSYKSRARMNEDYGVAAAGFTDNYVPAAPGVTGNMAPFDIGSVSLKKGEALVRRIGSANGTYENLVRCRIPVRYVDNGRRIWKNNGEFSGNLWECLRFKNPFKYAMPDAAVEIADGNRVLAQINGAWVNPGENATWEITKCRDVKLVFVEQEAPSSVKNRGKGIFQRADYGNNTAVSKGKAATPAASAAIKGGVINGVWYLVTDVKGHMELKNFRKTPVKTVIEMEYFGEFVSASGKPVRSAVNHFGSLNPKNKLIWNITLKPGETRKLDFRYNIIVNR
ncbi:MAG: hypothetical protein IKA87_09675 [Lentisphaeria bacterium]|nr:hypothetical protein [Lentisphaeria bacterium]